MKVLAHVDPADEDTMLLVLKGCVGEAAAADYLGWLATAGLYDPIEVMNDPSIVDWKHDRPDRLFALTTALTALALNDAVPDAWAKSLVVLTACATGGKPDVATPAARTLLNRIPRGKRIPVATREAFSDLFERTGKFAA